MTGGVLQQHPPPPVKISKNCDRNIKIGIMKDMLSLFKIKEKKRKIVQKKNADINNFSEIHTRYIYAHKSCKKHKIWYYKRYSISIGN